MNTMKTAFQRHLKLQHFLVIIGLLVGGAVLFKGFTGVVALCAFLFTTLMAHTVIVDKVYAPHLANLEMIQGFMMAWFAHILLFFATCIWMVATLSL